MLTDHSVDPKSGRKPEYLVIFFHGYGSNGALMAGHVGKLLGPELPEAKIRCPDGPVEIGAKDGQALRSWFEIRDQIENGKSPDRDEMAKRATAAAKEMNDYITKVIAEEGIAEDHVILAGFSLGATMAYYAGLLRDTQVGAVYALSGGVLEKLTSPKSKPPVGLVAGGEDTVSYSSAWHTEQAFEALKAASFRTDCVIIPGQGHDISWKSMELLAVYARNATAKNDNRRTARPRRNTGPRP